MNIYELDAASNNAVEDIRALVDQVRYVPQMGKYKIYIIDEVHMLSNAAFNAFLKTLEEPPNYVLFILATTERHKVLPTILSRCQIFNFNSIKIDNIVDQLKLIAKQESIAYEVAALQLIAQKAEGAMRDALSMFDIIATAIGQSGTITYNEASAHLQHLDYAYYFRCTESFLKQDIPALLSIYDAILRAGFNGRHFLAGLGEHLRNLLVCKDQVSLPLLEVPDPIRPQYAEYAVKCSMRFLLDALARLNQYILNYQASQHKRLHVELFLIELATVVEATDAAVVLDKSGSIKKKIVPPPKPNTCIQPPSVDNGIACHIQPKSQNNRSLPGNKVIIQAAVTEQLPTLADLKKTLTETEALITAKQASTVKAEVAFPPVKQKVEAALTYYKEQLKKKGMIADYQLISQPIKVQDRVVSITLINPVQEAMLQNLKEDLLAFLRKTLHCSDIIIQGILVEEIASKRPYTDQEKLSYLSKKNAFIALLQEKLMLELAY
ncbi:DNA polymerase III subunit tau [Candidatus Cardinium hertigii]|uniref:DNA polymerase III subunit gamma/tau n=2 Tax=Candidatus Cardinium hertigii TaxID=247481 RepID=A0A2Z3L7I6_9BACT|nr:DNA polymerase III subunit tau [Candidatus Cardinium hertigii]